MTCRYDLIVRGGTLVTPAGVTRADLAVAGGKVAEVAAEVAGDAAETVDATGLHLFPGVVDAHVHFNEPGRADWEGVATGSAALAAGGGTLYADMPLNSHPPLLFARDFELKRRAAKASSYTDFALWGGLTPDNVERLPELAGCGVLGFKAFMASSGIPEFRAADDLTLLEGMRLAAGLGLPVAVHAESEGLTQALTQRIRAEGGRGVRDFLRSRPVVAELEAIGRALLFAEETGADLHIVHVSTGRGVALVAEAKARGVRATCETCPHYLVFTEEDAESLGAVLKCAPPLRPAADREGLWRTLLDGDIDFVASDHSPAPPELKVGEDFFAVWGGINGVQASLSALLTEGPGRGLGLERVAHLTAAAPAERFRLKGKGRLEPGFDADFALVDLRTTYTLDEISLLTRHKLSPYLGRTFRGAVKETRLRGRAVLRNGELVAEPSGRLVHPESTGASFG